MAEIKNNPLVKNASGMFGGMVVYRTWNGKTFMSSRPKKPTKESLLQKETRTKFKRATLFAKNMMKDPVKKAEYKEIAKELNLTNAYTAAITEFMRKPEIEEIDANDYTGKSQEEVKITVSKKGFDVQEVEVVVRYKNRSVIEGGKAQKGLGKGWIYKTSTEIKDLGLLQFHVKARERTNNFVEKMFEITIDR